MPLWGFDGSNEAVYDSTDLSGICLICSFRDDFQPAAAKAMGQPWRRMVSGAGHDACQQADSESYHHRLSRQLP